MRVLLVSIAFPPKRDPESLQVAKYCKYLNRQKDIQLEVVTSANPTLHMDTDDSLLPYATGIPVAYSVKIFENKYLNFLIRKINPDFLKYPDSKFSFWWQANRVQKKVNKPAIIYSRSYPVSSALMALQLKKKWNVPWMLHLSDPWAVGSANSLSPATHLTGKPREWNKKKEEECFALADCICLTSRKTIDLYKKAYPHFSEKFQYTPNVYDDDLIFDEPYQRMEKLSIVYTGGFGEARKPDTLLDAIRIFYNQHAEEIGDRIQFYFTGEMTRVNASKFEQSKDIPIIHHLGILPYKEVVELQRSAHILVNIDSDISDPSQAVFLPSKLLDYMVARKRILAITNSYSTTYEVVQGKLGDCFEFNETNQIADYFLNAWRQFVRGNDSYFASSNLTGEFSAAANAIRLSEMFQRLIKN